MRKIRNVGKIRFSELWCSEFIFGNKIIEFFREITLDTINKIFSNEIEIDLGSYKESFLKILGEQLFKKDDISYEELNGLDSRQLFKILNVFITNDDTIKLYFEKSDIKNPFIKFLTVIKDNLNEIHEEKIKLKKEYDYTLQRFREVIVDSAKRIDEASIMVLKRIYQAKGISEDEMDFSPEKKKIAMELINADNNLKTNCKNILEKYNWFINAEFGKTEQEKIFEFKNNEEKINEYILSISTNELIIKVVDVWKKVDILNRRMHIIEKCIKSYVEGEYWLFIPTMLAQLEGIVIDIFDIKGKYVIEDLKEKIDKLVDLTKEQFDSNARSFYIDIILSGFEVGKECEALSRHSILHGYNTEYGTKVNALKIIYFFDHVIRALYYASDSE